MPVHGSVYLETNEDRYLIDESHLGFLPPECTHAYRGDAGNEFLIMNIPEYMVVNDDMSRLQGGSRLTFDERWEAIRHLVMMELRQGKCSSSLNSLYYYFYQYITSRNISDSIRYINDHYAEDISIKTLADLEHYNVNYYYDWFRTRTGTTPVEYIKKLRMEKAKELLENTDYTVQQIAGQVGYQFNSSFSRAFKEYSGVSPAQYKRNI
jgi:AraC-like DNA-binding protein